MKISVGQADPYGYQLSIHISFEWYWCQNESSWEVLDEKLQSYTLFASEIDGVLDNFLLPFFVKAGLF